MVDFDARGSESRCRVLKALRRTAAAFLAALALVFEAMEGLRPGRFG